MIEPADPYLWVVEHLARGEEILVLDRLAHAAELERRLLDEAMERFVGRGARTQDGLDELLAVADDPELLGIAFAVASYGEVRAVRALAAAKRAPFIDSIAASPPPPCDLPAVAGQLRQPVAVWRAGAHRETRRPAHRAGSSAAACG